MDGLKRIIVDFKKLTPEVLKLLVDRYPYGYGDRDIITFKNTRGERIEAVEVNATEVKYLVKISAKLEITMANYDEDDYEDFAVDNPEAIPDFDIEREFEDK